MKNDTKQIMCNIMIEIKEENSYTYDQILSMQKERGKLPLNRGQLNSILVHKGKGVSVALMDDLFYSLGYTTEVVLSTHFNW